MKRKLIRQMLNEWQSNIWLAIEILLVGVVMWWLTDKVWTAVATYSEPLGYDISHCYLIGIRDLNEKSPGYVKYPDREARKADWTALLSRLRARPEVEALSVSFNGHFYNPNLSGILATTDTLHTFGINRTVTPDFFRVFRIHGLDGETPDELAEAWEKAPYYSIMAAVDLYEQEYGIESIEKFRGRKFYVSSDSVEVTLFKVLPSVRPGDFRPAYGNPTVFTPLDESDAWWANETVVRVRENMDKDFVANLLKDAAALNVGNFYIESVQPFDSIRETYNRSDMQDLRETIIWSVFLLVNIFLGILGTFWFRTSQRTAEIALRMVSGATRADIFRRVLGEGELILVAVMPFAAAAYYLLVHYQLNTSYHGAFFEPVRFIGCGLITFALISLMIVIGSWIPARKAMSISPAEALKTE